MRFDQGDFMVTVWAALLFVFALMSPLSPADVLFFYLGFMIGGKIYEYHKLRARR